jgi:hypothetical protein
MYLYHVLFVSMNIYGIDCQKKKKQHRLYVRDGACKISRRVLASDAIAPMPARVAQALRVCIHD